MKAKCLSLAAVTALAALLAAGCSSSDSGTTDSAGTDSASPGSSGTQSASGGLSGTVTVFAAASLQESFTTFEEQFEQANPEVDVILNLGASSALATGITQGQPADVFASASQSTMDTVIAAGAAESATAFAKNTMQIAVPPANPAGITALSDLTRSGVKVALCQTQVPCGKAAATVFDNASLTVVPVSEESDVKAVLTKVRLGEVDAGIVYVTDVRAAGGEVTDIDIPADLNASTTYPITTLTESENPAAARAFVEHVLSDEGAEVLASAGFSTP